MEIEQELRRWSQTLIYSVQQDISAEYEADKLIFHSNNVKNLFSEYENSVIAYFAVYGCYQDIENFINETYNNYEPLKFQEIIKCDTKGKIVLIHDRLTFIFCLVLPISFFLKKPIDEKSIQLTLFRILYDITQTIIVCINDEVIEQWSIGANIPFIQKRFTMDKFQVKKNEEEKFEPFQVFVHCLIPQKYDNWSLKQNNNHSQQFLLYNQFTLKEEDKVRLREELRITMREIFFQLYQNDDEQAHKYIIENISQEFQTVKIFEKFENLTMTWQKKIKKLDQDIIKNIIVLLKKKLNISSEAQVNQLQQYLQNFIKSQFVIKNGDFSMSNTPFPSQMNKIQILSIQSDLLEIIEKQKIKLNELLTQIEQAEVEPMIKFIFEERQNEQNIICQKCKFSSIRQINMENSTEKISITPIQQFQINSSYIEPSKIKRNIFKKFYDHLTRQIQYHIQVEIIDFFNTHQENTDILIVKKGEKLSVLSIGSKGEWKLITCLEEFAQPIFIYERKDKILFGFNHRNTNVVKLIISNSWKISNEKIFAKCQSCVLIKVIYMSFDKTYIGINDKGQVFKWSEDQKMFAEIKSLYFDSEKQNPQMKPFQPSKFSSQHYQLLEACPSGNHFFLSNLQVIDIYNVNHKLIKSIDFQGYFMIFNDMPDAFIFQYSDKKWKFENKSALVLSNLSNRQSIKKINNETEEEKKTGNPQFDIMRGSQVKYGPYQSFFLNNKQENGVKLHIINPQRRKGQIQDYLRMLQLSDTLCYDFLNQKQILQTIGNDFQEINKILHLLYTRVPLQLCTIENNQLIPLINGFRQHISYHISLNVLQRAKQLKLGYLEEYMMNLKEKIFVVSIIGQQSSGKSYLLNRLFGTRFAVAASRCTDGIWANITQINNLQFLVLDCEGLFSSQRTKKEETQLLCFLAAVSDVTILNQDLTFNRYLNDLLDHTTDSIEKLKGDKLFKGSLQFVLRDISRNDNTGALEQLLQNIQMKIQENNTNFFNSLFNNNFSCNLLSNFEHQAFSSEIDILRDQFLEHAQQTNHWQTGKELIQIIKILLIQLETSDNDNSNHLHFRLQLDDAVEKAKRNWVSLETELILQFQGKQIYNNSYVFYEEPETKSDVQQYCEKILKQICKDLKLSSSVSNHNENICIAQQLLSELIWQRKQYIFSVFDSEINSINVPENEIILNQKISLVRFIEEQEIKYEFCLIQCSKCYLKCSKLKNHAICLQNQINIKDNQMKNLKKKYDIEIKTLFQIEKEIQSDQEEYKNLQRQLCNSDSDIQYLIKFNQFLNLKTQLDNLLVSIKKCPFTNQLGEFDCAKLLQHLKNQLKQCDIHGEGIFIMDEESLEVTQLNFQLIELLNLSKNQKINFQTTIQNLYQKQKQIQQAKEELTLLQNQQIECNQQLANLKSSGFSLIETINNQKQQLSQLEEKLLEMKILDRFYLEAKNLFVLQETFENNIKEIENQIQKSQDSIQTSMQNKLKQQEVLQSKAISQLDEINNITQDQYIYLISNSKQYEIIKKQLEYLEHDNKIIEQRIELKKHLEDETEIISQQLKYIEIKQFKNYADAVVVINNLKKCPEDQKKNLEKNNIVQINCILNENNLGENNLSEFKILFQAAIKQELENSLYQLQAYIDEDIKASQRKLQEFENIKENHTKKLNYVTMVIQLQEKHSAIQNNQTEIQKVSEKLILIKKKMQKFQEMVSSNDNNMVLINQFSEKMKLLDQNIKTIQEAIQEIKNYNLQQTEFRKIEKNKKTFETDLINWARFDDIKNRIKTEQTVKDMIKQEEEINEQFRMQKDEIQQRLETLLEIAQLEKELNQLKSQEKQEHSCLRESHICDEECFACKNIQCNKKAGHQQEHLCEKLLHYCDKICCIDSCQSLCKKQLMHDGQHHCENMHNCKIPCQFCGGVCQREYFEDHEEHICQLKGCIQKCKLCDRFCNKEHQHSRQEGDIHLCENIHSCTNQCNQPGVCFWEYQEERRVWKTEISSFDYKYFKLIEGGKQPCSMQIQVGKMSHGEIHSCKTDAHRCGQKCPECYGLCTKNYGHEGLHFTNLHRNKDRQVFTLEVGLGNFVEFSQNLKTYKYQVGESSCPETCGESCERRSRSHFHLIQCEGGDKCLGNINKYSRHQIENYQGFEDVQFDEVLCFEYWRLKQWEHPLQDDDKLITIQSCNYFCPFCSETKKSFCQLPAWHVKENNFVNHKFVCEQEHIENKGLDIVFVIDSTGSMKPYIEQAKLMVKNIMVKANLFQASKDIRFGIVAYRDHPPQDESFVTQSQQLGTEMDALAFLNNLKAEGGGDYPEAVLDGLQEAVNLKWQSNHGKMIFLIGDAPPHGKAYSDQGQWPEGCPCNIKENQLFKNMECLSISFKILELNSGLNKMIQVFKRYITLEVLKQDQKVDFVTLVVAQVCQQMEITFQRQ